MISVSKAEGEPMELQCTAEWPPDSREAIQLGERFMSSRIFKRSARAFRAPRIARQRMLPPPEYPRIPNRDRVTESPQMKPPAGTQLGNLLRHWRNVRGRNQLDLSIETGISQRHISSIESGRSNPGRQTL